MKNTAKVWLTIAVVLFLAGCVLVRLASAKYQTNTYEIGNAFRDISIKTDTTDIKFASSDDGTCKVECHEQASSKHSVSVENDTLVVRSHKSWFDYLGFHFGSSKITVYLPKAEYNALSIREITGDVTIPKEHSFDHVDISLTTGDVDFSASVSNAVKIKAVTGDIRVKNTSAGSLDLSVTTGNVTASGVSCREDITVNVVTGGADLTDSSCRKVVSNVVTGNVSLHNVIEKARP